MFNQSRKETSEKVYADRLCRHVVRLATRKALFAVRQMVIILCQCIFGNTVQPIDSYNKYSLPFEMDIQPDLQDDDPEMPNSIREYLCLLAEELETAEVDLDD